MAEKETKSCSDCIHYDVCYKIEHFGRDLESTSPCEQFLGKNDVAPVKHAKWAYGKLHGQSGYYCSECGAGFADINPNAELIAKSHNYCPSCGAKMDLTGGK